MEDLIYKTASYLVIGICMEVYNTLGYGFLEIVYKDAMEIWFLQRNINYQWEDEQSVHYKGSILKHRFLVDFNLHQQIITELKSNKAVINNESIAQTLNYLKASQLKLALIINFDKKSLEYKRLVY